MALKHVNRRGDTYYLQAGATKTGKPKYYFGRQLSGVPVEDLLEAYEIHEGMNDVECNSVRHFLERFVAPRCRC